MERSDMSMENGETSPAFSPWCRACIVACSLAISLSGCTTETSGPEILGIVPAKAHKHAVPLPAESDWVHKGASNLYHLAETAGLAPCAADKDCKDWKDYFEKNVGNKCLPANQYWLVDVRYPIYVVVSPPDNILYVTAKMLNSPANDLQGYATYIYGNVKPLEMGSEPDIHNCQ